MQRQVEYVEWWIQEDTQLLSQMGNNMSHQELSLDEHDKLHLPKQFVKGFYDSINNL